jgi:hypothetical protein
MAVATDNNHLRSNLAVTMYDHDPDGTSATDVAWVDMRDYDSIMVIAMASALTGNGATAFTLLANNASDGSGTDVEIKAHAVGSAPDAVGDYLVLECSAEEIRGAETTATEQLRYVSANLTMNNAADENVVTYIRGRAKFAADNLTADSVA